MRKILITFFILVSVFLLCSCNKQDITVPQNEIIEERDINLKEETIHIINHKNECYLERDYIYTSHINTCVSMFRAFGSNSVTFEYEISDDAVIRCYDSQKGWLVNKISDNIPESNCYYIDDNTMHYWIYMPMQYKQLENHSIKYIDKDCGNIRYVSSEDHSSFIIEAKNVQTKCFADFMIIRSEEALFDWNMPNEAVQKFMCLYNLDGDGRWCYDGYYFPTEDSYVPYGKDIYYFCVDSYIIGSFNDGTVYNGCAKILIPMIDTVISHQTDEGYIPTYSYSTWLHDEYDIEPGFYDTRFNTDLWDIIINAYEKFGGESIKESIKKYGEFYKKHVDNNRIFTSNGFFVGDYYNPSGGKLTHASLNHNLAEIELCFKLNDLLKDYEYQEIALSIIKAIEDTKESWIMTNKNLEYAILPDLSFGYTDYPYLTYNDLYDTQKMLEEIGYGRNEALDYLMKAKKIWMDSQGIKEYKK